MLHYSGSTATRGTPTPYSCDWRIEGTTGQLLFSGDGADGRITLTRLDPEVEESVDIAGLGAAAEPALCRDFIEAVRTGVPGRTSAKDNVRSLAMVFAIGEAARTRCEVPVDA